MAIVIRQAKADDLELVKGLFAQTNQVFSSEHAEKLLSQSHCPVFLIHDEDQPIGLFSLLIMDNLAHQGTPSGFLEDIVIVPGVERKKVEPELMDFIVRQCNKVGCYKLCLPNDSMAMNLLTDESRPFAQHGKCFVMDLDKRKDLPFRVALSDLTLRKASVDDLPMILQLYAQPGMDDGNVLAPEQAKSLYKKMTANPNYSVFIVFSEKSVVGTFALLTIPSLTQHGKFICIIEGVMVSPDAQGKGVGKFMMDFALRACEEMNCYRLALSSNIKRSPAHNFYKNLGFLQTGASFLVQLRSEPKATPFRFFSLDDSSKSKVDTDVPRAHYH